MACSSSVKSGGERTKFNPLFFFKKNALDSFSTMSKRGRVSPEMGRTNTDPVRLGRASSWNTHRKNYVDVTKTTPHPFLGQNGRANHLVGTSEPDKSTPQASYQTWPQDDRCLRSFEDQSSLQTPFSITIHPPRSSRMNQQSEINNKDLKSIPDDNFRHNQRSESRESQKPSVRHQGIQTDSLWVNYHEMYDANTDIIRYLNQLNDNVGLNMQAPIQLRRSGSVLPVHVEPGPVPYTDYSPRRQLTRGVMDYTSLNMQYVHPYHLDNVQYGRVMMPYYERARPIGAERAPLEISRVPDFLPTADLQLLAPPRTGRRVSSEDSGSIFGSSETDSDFVFVPCRSLSQSLQAMTIIDSGRTAILSPPPDLPENVNVHFNWRSDFYGSSLDDITLQFFLDDDALSDDVFVDDPGTPANTGDKVNSNVTRFSDVKTRQEAPPKPNIDHHLISQTDVITPKEHYGDNCYAYRYADIDEFTPTAKIRASENISETPAGQVSTYDIDYDQENPAHLDNLSNALSLQECASVFDSLRRNSSQNKARKMWRQRRIRANRKAGNAEKHPKLLDCSDHGCETIQAPYNSQPKVSEKPLKGILKNKDATSDRIPEPPLPVNGLVESADTNGASVYEPGSEHKFASGTLGICPTTSNKKRPVIKVSYAENTPIDCNGLFQRNILCGHNTAQETRPDSIKSTTTQG